jgi:hypothetical protein
VQIGDSAFAGDIGERNAVHAACIKCYNARRNLKFCFMRNGGFDRREVFA